jgi:hypothetical protein
MNLGRIKVYAEWPWRVDFHHHGCPLQISMHTRSWFFAVRPFSGFAQGGDLRGVTEYHDQGRSCKWELMDENPDIWVRLREKQYKSRPVCTSCLYDAEMCDMIACHRPHHVRFAVFPRHLWREHLRWQAHGRGQRCTRFRWDSVEDME